MYTCIKKKLIVPSNISPFLVRSQVLLLLNVQVFHKEIRYYLFPSVCLLLAVSLFPLKLFTVTSFNLPEPSHEPAGQSQASVKVPFTCSATASSSLHLFPAFFVRCLHIPSCSYSSWFKIFPASFLFGWFVLLGFKIYSTDFVFHKY